MDNKKPIKSIIISVTNDLVTDQRVNKVCISLLKQYPTAEITLVGRKLNNSLELEKRIYHTHRMKLLFEKGFAFYAEYNFRLFFYLLVKEANLLVANDLDTLLPNYLISKLKKNKLVYDSHEYFCQVPELLHRPFVKNIWKKIERFILPKLPFIITVSDSIAMRYEHEYKIKNYVIRNLPHHYQISNKTEIKNRIYKQLGMNINQKLIIYQGAINKDRGIEEAILAMNWIENSKLLIIGFGDIYDEIWKLIQQQKLENKVILLHRISFEKLKPYTLAADLGISLEKDTNLNYRFSLPNKMFDYIAAEIPVLASALPEITKIFQQYEIGDLLTSHEPAHIAEKINFMLNNQDGNAIWNEKLKLAKEALCWEKEELKLLEIYRNVI